MWCGYPTLGGPWGQPQMCGEIPSGACGRGGICKGIGDRCLRWCLPDWEEVQVPPVREDVNGHLSTSPLVELPAELIEGEAMCSGVVGDGLVGVHDSPGLVTVNNLGCHPSMGELGGWGVGRGGSSKVG